jgi:hypothetical protein
MEHVAKLGVSFFVFEKNQYINLYVIWPSYNAFHEAYNRDLSLKVICLYTTKAVMTNMICVEFSHRKSTSVSDKESAFRNSHLHLKKYHLTVKSAYYYDKVFGFRKENQTDVCDDDDGITPGPANVVFFGFCLTKVLELLRLMMALLVIMLDMSSVIVLE